MNLFKKYPQFFIPGALFDVSALSLAVAYIAEYGFDLKPCILCLYQRIPYAVVLVLAFLTLCVAKKWQLWRPLLLVAALVFAIGAGIAMFHVGVEQHWWEGTEKCAGGGDAGSIEELRAQIMDAPIVRCDEPNFWFLGFTMAAWNILYSMLLVVGCLWASWNFKTAESQNLRS